MLASTSQVTLTAFHLRGASAMKRLLTASLLAGAVCTLILLAGQRAPSDDTTGGMVTVFQRAVPGNRGAPRWGRRARTFSGPLSGRARLGRVFRRTRGRLRGR